MEPSYILVQFYTMDGYAIPSEHPGESYSQIVHVVGPIRSHTVKRITVGENRVLYGHVLKEINGKNVREYIHLREGTYRFTRPFQFLSLHMDYIESEIIKKLR